MKYNWQQPDWCDFACDIEEMQPDISEYALIKSERSPIMYGYADGIRQYALLQMMITESIKTSESETGYAAVGDAGPSPSSHAE